MQIHGPAFSLSFSKSIESASQIKVLNLKKLLLTAINSECQLSRSSFPLTYEESTCQAKTEKSSIISFIQVLESTGLRPFIYSLCTSRSFNPRTLPQDFKKCQGENCIDVSIVKRCPTPLFNIKNYCHTSYPVEFHLTLFWINYIQH